MMARCIVPPEQLLDVNLFEEGTAATTRKITEFVAKMLD